MVKKISNRARACLVLSLSTCLACFGFLSASCFAREVKRITIEAAGLYEHDTDPTVPIDCKEFRPTARQIKHFFSRAYPVEGYVFMHSKYSPCYAKGSIDFADGHFGKWVLSSGGAASLTFNRGDHVTVYYPKNEWNDPFGAYDGDEGLK